MLTDIEIAQQGKLLPISEIAKRLAIPEDALSPYGRTKGKISLDWIAKQEARPDGKLILVTAISPTPAGRARRRRRSAWATGSIASAGRPPYACASLRSVPSSA
jgi:formyltetrahydrofolate synthetase